MDRQRALTALLLCCILYLLISPGSPPADRHPHHTVVQLQQSYLAELDAAGFDTPPRTWPRPSPAAERAWRDIRAATPRGEVYNNATGELHGTWSSLLPANRSSPLAALTAGRLEVTIEETTAADTSDLRMVTVWVKLKTPDWEVRVDSHLPGLHWVKTGEVVVASLVGEGWPGAMVVPWTAGLAEAEWTRAKRRISAEVKENVRKAEQRGGAARAREGCGWMMWLKLQPVDPEEEGDLEGLERELRWPTGVRGGRVPELRASALVESPGCGVLLRTHDLVGEKVQVRYRKWRAVGLGAALVAAAEMWLLERQMRKAETASLLRRVSLKMVLAMAVADGFYAVVFGISAVRLDPCFLALITACFTHLLLVFLLELRFISSIFRAAPPADPPRPPAGPRAQLPAPAVAPTAPQLTTEQRQNHDLHQLRLRVTFLIFLAVVFSIYATSLSPTHRAHVVSASFFLTNSSLLLQFAHNTRRNTRGGLDAVFTVAMSLLRLAPAAYLHLYPGNVLHFAWEPRKFAGLCAWAVMQIALVMSQDVLGARWFLPRSYRGWDYHPAVIGDEESPGGGGADCAVCMNEVERKGGVLGRRERAVTRCRHVFHTKCLREWGRFREVCPVCRAPLDPL